jgi:hypothetical protein
MKNLGYMIASAQVALERQPVGWMYRETPTDVNDSGWRVFSGNEDVSFKKRPTNFGIYNAETIVEIDPEIEEFLLLDIGVEVERCPTGKLIVSNFGGPSWD